MADNLPVSMLADVNKRLSQTENTLGRIQSKLNGISGTLRNVGQGFASAFSGNAGGGGAVGGGGTGGLSTGGSMMPWIYTKSGAVAYGGAQAAVGAAAAGYSLMPSLSIALPTRAAYYGGAILSPGMTAAGLAQRTLGALGQGVTSPTDAAAAQMMLSQTYNFNPGGASYLRAMQEVGGAARMMNISNPQAAQAIAGLHTGAMSSRLYQLGISTLDPKTGNIRSTEDIYRQIYNRYYGGKGNITTQNIEVGLREGFIGAELRNVLGFSDTEMQMFQKAAINFSQGKRFNLPDATGKGNPQLDIYRQQTSLAQTTESKADELLAGLTTATDAYIKMNNALQGDGGVVSGLAKLKGVLEGLFGTNAGGAIAAITSTVGSIATTALMFKGVKALQGASAAGVAASTRGAGIMGAGSAAVDAQVAGVTANVASQVGSKAIGVGTKVARFGLGKALPIVGGAISAETGQGFLSTVAVGAAAGGIGGALFGGVGAIPGALLGGGLSALGWLGDKAFRSMFATSKTQQTGGSTADMSQEKVAQTLLQRINAPVNDETMSAMLTWMNREGGNWKNTAKYNPLNTMMKGTNSVNYNTGKKGGGVQAYQNWDSGLQATVDTLQQRNMSNIVAAFQQGQSARDILQQIQKSPWDAGRYGGTLATSPLIHPGSSATTSSGQTVNINLKIDKASDAEAIAFAKKVKEILMKDKSVYNTGSK